MGKEEKKELNGIIGRRLKQIRHERDLTQEQAAEALSISLAFYGRIERGQNGLTLERVIQLYEKLDIDPTYLLTGEKRQEIKLDIALNQCPREKRFDMEQLVKYAINLAKDEKH